MYVSCELCINFYTRVKNKFFRTIPSASRSLNYDNFESKCRDISLRSTLERKILHLVIEFCIYLLTPFLIFIASKSEQQLRDVGIEFFSG